MRASAAGESRETNILLYRCRVRCSLFVSQGVTRSYTSLVHDAPRNSNPAAAIGTRARIPGRRTVCSEPSCRAADIYNRGGVCEKPPAAFRSLLKARGEKCARRLSSSCSVSAAGAGAVLPD